TNMTFADADEEAVFVPAPGNLLATTLPGFLIEGMAPGEQLWLEAVSRLNFAAESAAERWLWYWAPNSGKVQDLPLGLTLEVASSRALSPSALLSQTTSTPCAEVQAASLLSSDLGEHRHLLAYLLDGTAAPGAYGFFAKLTSP